MGTAGSRLATWLPSTLDGSRLSGRTAFDDLAARTLSSLVGISGAIVLVSGLVQGLYGHSQRITVAQAVFGLGLVAIGLAAMVLHRQGRRRPSIALAIMASVSAAGLHALVSGLGTQSIALAGSAMLLVLSGVLVSVPAVVALASLNLGIVIGLYGLELAGSITPALGAMPATRRMVAYVALNLAGLTGALLLGRLFAASLGRALEQEQRLNELLRIGSDWTWELDRQARLAWLSPSFEERTGRPRSEFMHLGEDGEPQIVEDEDWRQLRRVLRRRRPFRDRDLTLRCADGALLVVRSTGEPVKDANGRFAGWRGVCRDVTSERLAQQQQRRAEVLIDRLVQTSPDAICVARLRDGAILLVNQGFTELSGLTEQQILGRSALEIGLWRDPGEPLRLRDALARDGTVRNLRSVAWVRGVQQRDVLLTAGAFEWDGEPVAVITTRDITEIERARLEADAILDNASIGIALVRDQRFERVNPPLEAMFGCARGSLAGQPTTVLYGGNPSYEAFAAWHEQAWRAGEAVEAERTFERADGRHVVVRMRARPVDVTRPAESGVIVVAEDVTERRRADRELAEAKQQAESASEAKSAFLATMSHEIRTPLNGVLGLARLLQDDALDALRRHEYLGHLVDAAELLAGTVSDVLDLSKIEAGHLELEHIPFDLPALVANTFHTFAPLGRERGLAMGWSMDESVPARVRGDPVRLRQILANYLTNALKFTSRGSIMLRMSRAGADRIRLTVADTGPGVAAEVSARLFQPFVQADSSTTRRFGGSGLGLSICRELAQRMGGSVGVDSDGVSGSSFWAEVVLPPVVDDERAGTSPAVPPRPLAGQNVLVAEDNAVNMLIVGAMLRRLGAEVLEAGDGAEAVELAFARAGQLDAVLMDLHMPVVDGLTATRRLRADARTRTLPVYALSAAVLEHERQDAAAAGMDGFIAKPIVEAELLRVLRAVVT